MTVLNYLKVFPNSIKHLILSYIPKYSQGIYVYNWWGNTAQNFWLTHFIQARCSPKKRINFFSCFERPLQFIRYYKGASIFYTGENLQTGIDAEKIAYYAQHRVSEVDLSLGFELREEPNYYRFPLWIMHRNFILPNATYADIRDMIDNINNPAHRSAREREKERQC